MQWGVYFSRVRVTLVQSAGTADFWEYWEYYEDWEDRGSRWSGVMKS